MSNHDNHSVSIESITPDRAREILNKYKYKGQRAYRPEHAMFLAKEMSKGSFSPTAEVVVSSEPNGDSYLINGQHTLNAIIIAGAPQKVTFWEYQSKDENDTAMTYSVIDTNLHRSIQDAMSALQVAENLGFTHTQVNQLGAAVKVIKASFRSNNHARLSVDELKSAIVEYAEAGHSYYQIANGKPKDIGNAIFRAATLSVALVTLHFSAKAFGKDKVVSFWNGVIFDDSIPSNDARKVANRHLVTTGMFGGTSLSTKYKNSATIAYSSRYISNCFNAYMEDRPITITKVMDLSSSIRITGSPFTGK